MEEVRLKRTKTPLLSCWVNIHPKYENIFNNAVIINANSRPT